MAKYLNRTDLLLRGLIQQLKLYSIVIIVMTIFRLVFLLYFSAPQYFEENLSDILAAFVLGWKYDSIVASYLMVFFYLLVLPISLLKDVKLFNLYQWLMRFGFVLGVSSITLIMICDLGFYSFFQDHINILFFGLVEDDTRALLDSIEKGYPLKLVIGALLIFVVVLSFWSQKLFKKIKQRELPNVSAGFFKYITLYVTFGILLFGGLRGGYGPLVLAPKYSDFSKIEFINHLSYNGVIALDEAIRLRNDSNQKSYNMTKAMGYGDDIYEAFKDYIGIDVGPTPKDQLLNLIRRRTSEKLNLHNEKFHVVVFVMESFGNHWLKYQSESFDILGDLSAYFAQGHYFKNIISSDNGTIGSLMTLTTNIPPRPGKRFLSESKFMRLPLDSASHLPFKRNGYETTFVYGGKLSWRNIGAYMKVQAFHNLIGENIIRSDLKLVDPAGTEWGLYDEHLFNHTFDRLKRAKRPQFILALSTSNHPPFEVPKNYRPKNLILPQELENKILREKDLFMQRFLAYQYANQALADFLKRIEENGLKEKVIVAITGDHNFWGFINYELSEAYSKYRVPLFLSIPDKIKPQEFNPDRIGSHEDIMITLYNLSLSNTEYFSFGEDLFSTADSFAINSGIYASKEGVVYKGKNFLWDSIPMIQTDQLFKKFDELDTRYRSIMTISDYYLESMLKAFRTK